MTPEAEPPFLAVEPGYRHVLRIQLLISWLPLAIGAIVADRMLLGASEAYGALSVGAVTLALASVIIVPERRYRRLRYRLTDRLLQSLRGWMVHTDTIVPFVRVQHLDVTRGPLDKMFGTASLVVHTAGTHNSIVTINGLAPERAAEIRDVIREHVRSDFA